MLVSVIAAALAIQPAGEAQGDAPVSDPGPQVTWQDEDVSDTEAFDAAWEMGAMDSADPPEGYDGDVDLASLRRIFVRNSSEAMEVEVEHPLQHICVRKLLPGSRVKARTMCQDKTSWKAYGLALDAMIRSWADTGVPLEENGDPTPGKSFGMGR